MFNEFGLDGNLGFNTFEDRTSNPNPINWNAIIQQAFAVGSHAISAYSGQNTGTQVGYNSAQGGVFAIQPTVGSGQNYAQSNPYANWTPAQIEAERRRQGGLAEDAASGIMGFIEKHPIPIAGGVLALFLLMREPPKRR